MEVDLRYDSNVGWVIYVEPENDMEQCAFDYLASRPKDQISILITRLGLFKRNSKEKDE